MNLDSKASLIVTVVLSAMIFAAFGVAGGALLVHTQDQGSALNLICHAQNRQNSYLHQAIVHAEKSLPTVSYYKHHPRELGYQLAQLQHEEQQFRPTPC